MRFPNDRLARLLALSITSVLTACGHGAASVEPAVASTETKVDPYGPAADYPVVIGDPYTQDGKRFVPVDTLNYDEIGYAAADAQGGAGVTASHHTLPLPSYVEVTALDTGKTALVRVERRGPENGNALIALSPAAQAQLGIAAGAPICVRRVNPVEDDRRKLRMGQAASARMDMPTSLLSVLRRKLPEAGSANLATTPANLAQAGGAAPGTIAPQPAPAGERAPVRTAASDVPRANTAYPLPPLAGARMAPRPPVAAPVAPRPAAVASAPAPATLTGQSAPIAEDGNFVVQAAAFSSKANADRAASTIGGFVEEGRYYRVRKGPFASRGQAEAALAKVRADGYSEARVFTVG